MCKKVVLLLTTFILVASFSGCGKYDAPISSKTYDVRSFRIEDGKKIPIDPIFSKTVFEYENEPESKIDFVEWKPKPLLAKGELEQFWVEDLKDYYRSMRDDEYSGWPSVNSDPEGWVIRDKDILYVLDTKNASKKDTIDWPMLYDANSNLCIGRYKDDNNLSCWDKITGEIKWNRPIVLPNPEIHSRNLYINRQNSGDLIKIRFSDGSREWHLKSNQDRYNDDNTIYTIDNYLWIEDFNFWDKKHFYIVRFDPEKNEALEFVLPGGSKFFIDENKSYYITKKMQIFLIDKNNLSSSIYLDFSNLFKDVINDDEDFYIFKRRGLYSVDTNSRSFLFDFKKKSIVEEPIEFEHNGETFYVKNANSIWGLDPNTLEKTWYLDTSKLTEKFIILLIDERGVLIKDNKKLYGFRPKK